MLPRGSTVGGKLWIDARGEGPIGDLPLEARSGWRNLRSGRASAVRRRSNGQIDMSGTEQRSGDPEEDHASPARSCAYPNPERNLHPVTGEHSCGDSG